MIEIQKKSAERNPEGEAWGNIVVHDEEVFDKARKIFRENEYLRNKQIPVVDQKGNLLYFLQWKANRVDCLCYVDDFWNYDIEDPLIDYELLDRGEVYLFFRLEEYTYQIARIIQKKYPEKYIFFTDINALLFFKETARIHIIQSIADLYNNYKKCISKTILTIDSKKEFLQNEMRFIIKRYRSLGVMTSLFWRCNVTSYGIKNPDKTFYVIKDSLGSSGLGDMIKRALCKIAMIQDKPGNIIPVIDFSVEGDENQFTGGNGENAWTLYFEQVCDISLEEVYESKNVIISSHDGWDWYNPYIYEKLCFMDWKRMFRDYLHIKDDVQRYIEALYNKTIHNKKVRILGVIGRGTDCRSTRGGMPDPLETNLFIYEVKKAMKQWACESIFLATEDQQVYDAFMESSLRDKIETVEQYRIDYSNEQNYDMLLSEIKIREHKNGYDDSLNYLGILYILSKCDSLISTCWCGALRCAVALNNGKYSNVKIF